MAPTQRPYSDRIVCVRLHRNTALPVKLWQRCHLRSSLRTVVLVASQYSDAQLGKVIECTERMDQHLTAAVVSRDVEFVNHVLANTINGTTYAGIRREIILPDCHMHRYPAISPCHSHVPSPSPPLSHRPLLFPHHPLLSFHRFHIP